jgi:hypothetical protein
MMAVRYGFWRVIGGDRRDRVYLPLDHFMLVNRLICAFGLAPFAPEANGHERKKAMF